MVQPCTGVLQAAECPVRALWMERCRCLSRQNAVVSVVRSSSNGSEGRVVNWVSGFVGAGCRWYQSNLKLLAKVCCTFPSLHGGSWISILRGNTSFYHNLIMKVFRLYVRLRCNMFFKQTNKTWTPPTLICARQLWTLALLSSSIWINHTKLYGCQV